MKKILNLLLIVFTFVYAMSAAAVQPTGSWLITTKTQFKMQPTASGAAIAGTSINGKEIGTFYSDRTYFSTEWLNKQRLYYDDSVNPYVIRVDAVAQWIPKNSLYTVTYDPYMLSVTPNSGKNAIHPFLKRIDFIGILAKSQNNAPVVDDVRMLSYIDNGQVLSGGKKLKGKKQIYFLVQWHDAVLTNQYATITVTEDYTAIPYPITSVCCGNDVAKNADDSAAFLAKVDSLPGIYKTQSGLRYLILQEGNGVAPLATDKVMVNYRGFYPSGNSFDSNSLISFNLGGVIPGWTEGLQLMKPGSKYRFFIPSDLAYGVNGNSSIKGNSALVFDVELFGVVTP